MNELHYDIISDIHGRFDKLAALMERMGYQSAGEGFIPPAGHKALFLGDLIDTKPGHPLPGGVRATLRAVKAMCDAGHALCLMGNGYQNPPERSSLFFHELLQVRINGLNPFHKLIGKAGPGVSVRNPLNHPS
jgi:hypothetical protein